MSWEGPWMDGDTGGKADSCPGFGDRSVPVWAVRSELSGEQMPRGAAERGSALRQLLSI